MTPKLVLILSITLALPPAIAFAADSTPSSAGGDIASKLAKKIGKIKKAYPSASCDKLPKFAKALDKGAKELDNLRMACGQLTDGDLGSSSTSTATSSSTSSPQDVSWDDTDQEVGKLRKSYQALKSAHDQQKERLSKDCSSQYQEVDHSLKTFGQKLEQVNCSNLNPQ